MGGKMMKRKYSFKKALCLLLAAAIAALSIPFSAFAAEPKELNIGVISDIHYFAPSSMGSDLDKFAEISKMNASTSFLAESIMDSAFAALKKQAEENGMKFVLVPGDLTKNGEYTGHIEIAKRLRQFEKETGVQILVINGNHDINNSDAAKFKNGKWVDDAKTSPELFRSIYADLGYDLADSFYKPEEGKAGGLSYAATIDGYRIIALDGGVYSSDVTADGTDEHETRGEFTPGLMEWAVNEIKKAEKKGLTVIGLSHFNFVPHFEVEESILEPFVIADWQRVNETFADAGMHYAFTGHIHLNDVAAHTNDNGETLTDLATTSILSFPNNFRTVRFTTEADGKVTCEYQSHDVDEVLPVSFNGETFEKPFKNTSFAFNFGGDMESFISDFLEYQFRYGFGADIKANGGLYKFLTNLLDVNALITDLVGDPLLGGLSATAVKTLLLNLCNQIERKYLNNVDYTMSRLNPALKKLLDIEVSDYPSTKWADAYGFRSAGDKGTLGDLVASALAYFYNNDEDPAGDKFLQSALDRFDKGENAETILNTLLTVLLDDLVQDTILKDIKIDPISLGLNGISSTVCEKTMQAIADKIACVGFTGLGLNDIINLVLSTGILNADSLSGVVYSFIGEYLTQSQYDTIDAEFLRIITDLTHDTNPAPQADMNGTVIYNGPVKVTPTVDALQLPSGVAVTLGVDSATTRNISYYTKYSLTNTDIQIVPYSADPDFSKGRVKAQIKTTAEEVRRTFSAVDFGVIGIIDFEFPAVRHTIEIKGLEPGKKYSYRIGDAKRGWWSAPGVIETADNTSKLSFFHITDPQAVTEKQYAGNWAPAIASAFKNHSGADFILGTGDLVDSGANFKHWQNFFNTAADTLMDTAMMTATGNHEEKGANATVDNFLLSNIPEQDTKTGVYYSFDYNTAHFAILNTNALNDDGTIGGAQLEWLKKDMAESQKAWKFVALHKAPYSNGAHFDDDDVIALRSQLSVLMPELNIDVVFQGHDHVYLRTDVMKNNAVVETETQTLKYNGLEYASKIKPDGTIYSINGTAGVKHYDPKPAEETNALFPEAEKVVSIHIPSYSYIQIDGGNLYFDSYSVENGRESRFDSFAISKIVKLDDGTTVDGTNNNEIVKTPDENNTSNPGENNGSENNAANGNNPNTSNRALPVTLIIGVSAALAIAGAATATVIVVKRRREEA